MPELTQPSVLGEKPPFHILFDFDLRDPCLTHLQFLAVDRLKLVYPLRYEHADLAYKLDRHGRLLLLNEFDDCVPISLWKHEPEPDWPTASYPISFERQLVEIKKFIAAGDERIEEVSLLFDLPKAGSSDHKLVLSSGGDGDLSEFEMIPNFDTERSNCAYRDCVIENGNNTKFPFAAIPSCALPGISIWGEFGTFVWIIFEVCEGCGTISNYNVCD